MEAPAPRYYPAQTALPAAATPLARYLPPLGAGMAEGWLEDNVPPGSWVLDPLGASPALVLEAARAGYKVLAAVNNPIIHFIIETLARAPKRSEFQAALAELATAKRGSERLEQHIQGLYLTECDACGERVPAQAFLWRKGEPQPYARIYHCPRCGENGEHPVVQSDLERLATMGGDKLQRSRALQRVILNQDEQRADVEEALENYLTRPLYALFTLLNKTEGLGLPPERARLLQALLITTFDAGTALWTAGPGGKAGGRARPRQLSIPNQFRENNLWLALEAAVDEWTGEPGPVSVTRWPDLPQGEGGAICLYRGRVKALLPLPEGVPVQAALAVFPRPNQAFWTLSALWAGWLWGPEAALPLRSALDRRRYDWTWHTAAVHSALAAVGFNLPREIPFFGILPELAPGFLSAVVAAAETAGFRLEGLALRPDSLSRTETETAQGVWRPFPGLSGAAEGAGENGEETAAKDNETQAMERAAREAIRADLSARAEPAGYLTEYAAGMAGIACAGTIPRVVGGLPGDLLTRVQAALARTFADRATLRLYRSPTGERPGGLGMVEVVRESAARETAVRESTARADRTAARPGETGAEEERGLWWLNQAPGKVAAEAAPLPLADRVEMEVVRFMQRRLTAGLETFHFDELDRAICAQFRGLLTPPVELVRACLESYGEPAGPRAEKGEGSEPWRLRENDSAAARKADLKEMHAAIQAVGRRFGYRTVEQGSALAWTNAAGQAEWWFYRMASSILSRYVLAEPPGPLERCVLVLPGGRARLLGFKLRRDPRLAEIVKGQAGAAGSTGTGGYRFLKFRHLREIAAQAQREPEMGLGDWTALLEEDPLTEEPTQMRLFNK